MEERERDRWMERWRDEGWLESGGVEWWMEGQMEGRTEGLMERRMERQAEGWMAGWMDRGVERRKMQKCRLEGEAGTKVASPERASWISSVVLGLLPAHPFQFGSLWSLLQPLRVP